MSDFNTKDLHTLNHLIHKLYSEGPVDRRLSDFLHQLFTVIFFDKAAIYFFRKNGDQLIIGFVLNVGLQPNKYQ